MKSDRCRVLHFADVHLGMTNLGKRNVDGTHSRILDFLSSIDNMVEYAQTADIDLCIFSGDAFKTRNPNPTLVNMFALRLQKLADIAPVIMVVGNHDRQKDNTGKSHSISIYSEILAIHPIIVAESMHLYRMEKCCVVTLPWLYDADGAYVRDKLLHLADMARDDQPLIMAGHCSVDGAVLNDNYSHYLGESDSVYDTYAFDIYDYVALGHIHKHQALRGMPHVVYSGSMESVDFGEVDDKGFVVADVGIGDVDWKFVSTSPRPLVHIEVDYDDLDSIVDHVIDNAVLRVTVNCKVRHDQFSIRGDVMKLLGSKAFLVDTVSVIQPADPRSSELRAVPGADNMTPLELIERYIDNKYPHNQEHADMLYFMAKDLISEVGDRSLV